MASPLRIQSLLLRLLILLSQLAASSPIGPPSGRGGEVACGAQSSQTTRHHLHVQTAIAIATIDTPAPAVIEQRAPPIPASRPVRFFSPEELGMLWHLCLAISNAVLADDLVLFLGNSGGYIISSKSFIPLFNMLTCCA